MAGFSLNFCLQLVPPKYSVCVSKYVQFAEIIQILKVKSPHSIYALAKLLDRDFKNVYDDVNSC